MSKNERLLENIHSSSKSDSLFQNVPITRHQRQWLLQALQDLEIALDVLEEAYETWQINEGLVAQRAHRQYIECEAAYHQVNEKLWEAYGAMFERYILEARHDATSIGLTPLPLVLESASELFNSDGERKPTSAFPAKGSKMSSMLDNKWRQLVLDNYQRLRKLDASMPSQKRWRI